MANATQVKIGRAAREAVVDCSSGPVYYDAKGFAFHAVNDALRAHGFHLESVELPGAEGRTLIDVYTGHDEEDSGREFAGRVVFAWYRMPSGRYELTCYVA